VVSNAHNPPRVAAPDGPGIHPPHGRRGLVLSGGGARGAYQAGVLQGVAEVLDAAGRPNPFDLVCGISAGSLNAALLAAGWHDIGAATDGMVRIWSDLRSRDVFRTGSLALSGNALRWLRQASLGGLFERHGVDALLDTAPLRRLLERELRLFDVHRHVADGSLAAFALSATDYESGHGVTFVEGPPGIPLWERFRRTSVAVEVSLDHLMASSAIPILFPPVRIDGRWYGDGGTRNAAPLSPAIHLGADQLVVVGVRPPPRERPPETDEAVERPSLARVLSTMINGILMDAVDTDVERLTRINRTLSHLDPEQRARQPLRTIDCLWIHPSQDLAEIAEKHVSSAPAPIRYLIGGLGPPHHAREIYSYLLFERDYCRALIELGRADARVHGEALLALAGDPRAARGR
jgi:NTE family protein